MLVRLLEEPHGESGFQFKPAVPAPAGCWDLNHGSLHGQLHTGAGQLVRSDGEHSGTGTGEPWGALSV